MIRITIVCLFVSQACGVRLHSGAVDLSTLLASLKQRDTKVAAKKDSLVAQQPPQIPKMPPITFKRQNAIYIPRDLHLGFRLINGGLQEAGDSPAQQRQQLVDLANSLNPEKIRNMQTLTFKVTVAAGFHMAPGTQRNWLDRYDGPVKCNDRFLDIGQEFTLHMDLKLSEPEEDMGVYVEHLMNKVQTNLEETLGLDKFVKLIKTDPRNIPVFDSGDGCDDLRMSALSILLQDESNAQAAKTFWNPSTFHKVG